MHSKGMLRSLVFSLVLLCAVLVARGAQAQKVYLNPSNQDSNEVAGGGVESQYALINANLAAGILNAAGFTAKVDQDFNNAPGNANSWGAEIFVSIHTNAGGGHGTETLYVSDGGKNLADHIQNGLLSKLPYQSRGLKFRDDLWVLNQTSMYACLTECVFHDCSSDSGATGHPPSESAFLRSADGQDKISKGIAAGVCTYFGKTCGATQPQKGTIKGVVYEDPDLAKHLAGAKVQVQGGASATYDGTTPVSFEVDPGDYTVTASLAGYESGSLARTVKAGEEVWASIGLKPSTPAPDASAPKDGSADVVSITEAGSDSGKPAGSSWAPGSDDGGCSCRVHASLRGSGGTALLLACAAMLLMRRK
jgi:hypothetical protein